VSDAILRPPTVRLFFKDFVMPKQTKTTIQAKGLQNRGIYRME
jgi:hypothetical protein